MKILVWSWVNGFASYEVFEAMNQDIDFSQIPLRDIHLPGEVAWWPPAPGWWLLLAVALVVLMYFVIQYVRAYRQRAALRALTQVQAMLTDGVSPAECLPTVSSVMRRYAMAVASNPQLVAGLVGERWLSYLDSRWDSAAFAAGPGRTLASAPYAPENACSVDAAQALTRVCIDWVRAQRLEN